MTSQFSDENYDDRGRWIREDRPEMLSDRLGYPGKVGDEDWQRIEGAHEQAESGTVPKRPCSEPNNDDEATEGARG